VFRILCCVFVAVSASGTRASQKGVAQTEKAARVEEQEATTQACGDRKEKKTLQQVLVMLD
jgi:hypothetical protein